MKSLCAGCVAPLRSTMQASRPLAWALVWIAVAASPAAAQVTTTLAELPLRVNLGDTITVTGPGGERWRGRVLDMTADGLTLRQGEREVVLSPADVRRVSVPRPDPVTEGAWIGFAVEAIPGMAVLASANDLSEVGWGLAILTGIGGMGAAAGACIDAMIGRRPLVLDVAEAPPEALASRTGPLADLAYRINLGDKVTVQDGSSSKWHGEVIGITPVALVLRVGDADVTLRPEQVHRVKMCCDSLQDGPLIGLAAGAALAAGLVAADDGDPDAGDLAGAMLGFGLIGMLSGIGIDAIITREVDVYRRAPEARPAPVTLRFVADPVGRRVAVELRW